MIDFNKPIPQDIELERAVLGAVLMDKIARSEVLDILKPESFFSESNGLIYETIVEMFDNDQAIDLLTVSQALKKKGIIDRVGGYMYLTELTSRVGTGANAETHARIVEQFAIRRRMIKAGLDISKNAYDETVDIFDTIDQLDKEIQSISENVSETKVLDMREVAKEFEADYKARQSNSGLTGIPTDSSKLDSRIGGWNEPDMIILAARPGMGKTAKALSIARRSAEKKYPVAFFTLEMSAKQLFTRMVAADAGIDINRIIKGEMSIDEFDHVTMPNARSLSKLPIYFIDKGGLSIREFKLRSRRLVKEKGVKLIIIDYLQLMIGDTNKNNNREQEISYISRNIKLTAKELKVPIIALSQLSRAVEQRGGDKRPMLGDLRESGSLEQDADMVIFLYRPEYYGILTDEDGNSTQGIMETIIAKFRNGNPGSVFEKCDLSTMRTGDYVLNASSTIDDEDWLRQPLQTSKPNF